MKKSLLSLCIIAALQGCTSSELNISSSTYRPAQTPPSADREAILAMAGEYRVAFAFDETVPLKAGYELREPKRSGAAELVLVVDDSPERIVLQHLLLAGDQVIKHWRQDWIWEAKTRFEFVADQTWKNVELSEEQTSGRWTQCVFEVSDAPRYCGTGRWNHRYGNPTWTSDRSWRPLPRREYTTRSDYNALNVENRHTITPNGWTHEQDNSKVNRLADGTQELLVREFGFNQYTRTDDIDFIAAYDYWDKTSLYWADVRDQWANRFDAGGVYLATDIDGMPIIDGLFALARQYEMSDESDEIVDQNKINEVFAAHIYTLE